MRATGIVRRIDELGRVVIPKEIRRTLRIREGDPTLITLAQWERFYVAMIDLEKRIGKSRRNEAQPRYAEWRRQRVNAKD